MSFLSLLKSKPSKNNPVIAWWSGGVTSAVACKLAIDWFGGDAVKVVMIDTHNEDDDTYRFLNECSYWYQKPITKISNPVYTSIQEVWDRYNSLNVANGAVCSTDLKRKVREQYQKNNAFSFQVFGFDISETNRAKAMQLNYPDSNPIFPLIYELLSKKECIKIIESAGIQIPRVYRLGYNNNNCFKTGCVQGGIGYWQKIGREQPEKFDTMAKLEHELTDKKGQPVTMLKDQGKEGGLVFLKPHPDYPNVKDISMMKGREPKHLMECNGFCGTNDLSPPSEVDKELNYELIK